jgi:FkbM family methyltransferase
MLNIKIFIGKFLECKFISYLFLLLNYKKNLKFHNTLLNVEFIDSINFVRIFFGYFEAAEIRFIKKYFSNNYDSLDIGAGMGIAISVFKKSFDNYNKKIICVEAVKKNILTLKKNFFLNKVKKYIIENKFLLSKSSNHNKKFIYNNDFSQSKLINSINSKLKKTDFINLEQLLKKYKIKKYQALIDIEGEELNFSIDDFKKLNNCVVLIIEIHTFNKNILNNFIKKLKIYSKLYLADTYGSVFVFLKK